MTGAHQYANWVLDPANAARTGKYIKLAAQRFLDDLKRTDIYFDETEAVKMIYFGQNHCYQWEGDWRGVLVEFQLWQRFIYEQVYGWFVTATKLRRFEDVYVQVAKKNGKALYIYEMIPTPTGWRTMLSLNPGDYVFGDDGRPAKIVAVSEIMEKPSYEITFQGGAKITAAGDHLWEVECNNWRVQKLYVSKRKPQIVDTDKIYELYSNRRITGANILHVKTCKPVEYPYQKLSIPPYLLGCWLGDGHSSGALITIGRQDFELIDHLRECGFSITMRVDNRSAPNFKIGGYDEFMPLLRQYGLVKNKHIPIEYLQSSIEQRIDLLKGLMDTDGTVSKKGQCTFSGCNKKLVEQVYELTLSLGIKSTFREKTSRCQTGAERQSYDVSFFEDGPVFKLKRKADRQKKNVNHRTRFRTIIDIKPVGVKPVKCIQIDNKSHLYLAGTHFIPTHNSTGCAVDMNFHLLADDRINTPKIFTAANNEDQAKICVNMAGRIIEQSPDLQALVDCGEVKLFNYKDNITEIVHVEKDGFIKAFAKESGDKKSKTSGGKHGINASLGIVDEFGMSPDHGASKPIKTSMAARKEGRMFKITTAGFNLDGPCYQEDRKVGIQVLNGVVKKDNFLVLIYEIDKPVEDGKEKDITPEWLLAHEEVWEQANPNIDVSVQRKFLRSMLEDAIAFGGTTAVDVLTLNFNMWMDSPEVFIPAEVWNKNAHGITEEDLEGQLCYGGIEIVGGRLLNSFVFLFPNVKGKTVIKPVFWMPDENKRNRESDQYENWVKEGFITTFLGNVSDNDKVYEILMEAISRYDMHSFAFKTNLENNDIVQALIKNDIKGDPISHGYQGISTPTFTWEEMLTSASMEHFNNPVLAWMNSNCMAVRKDHDIRLEKSGSRVVGIYAAINALAQWKTIEANPEEEFGIEMIEL